MTSDIQIAAIVGIFAGWFLKSLHTFTLDRIDRKRRRLRQLIEALDRGEDPNIPDPPPLL